MKQFGLKDGTNLKKRGHYGLKGPDKIPWRRHGFSWAMLNKQGMGEQMEKEFTEGTALKPEEAGTTVAQAALHYFLSVSLRRLAIILILCLTAYRQNLAQGPGCLWVSPCQQILYNLPQLSLLSTLLPPCPYPFPNHQCPSQFQLYPHSFQGKTKFFSPLNALHNLTLNCLWLHLPVQCELRGSI